MATWKKAAIFAAAYLGLGFILSMRAESAGGIS